MVSSLAAQLAQGVSLNAAQLSNRSRRHATESYLFSSRDAEHHDLDSIHAIASNGFAQLNMINPALAQWDDLFSDSSKEYDRTLVSPADVKVLNTSLGGLLRALSPYLLDAPTAKVIEWLVRRYRVHEFNHPDILRCFLPYHDSTAFSKMVSILHIQNDRTWAFLQPQKSSAAPLTRTALVTEMTKSMPLLRFITELLPNAIKHKSEHRALVAFHTGTLAEYLSRVKIIDEVVLGYVLPSLTKGLAPPQRDEESKTDSLMKDIILSSSVLLAALSQRCTFTTEAREIILTAILASNQHIGTLRAWQTVVAVVGAQDNGHTPSPPFSEALVQQIMTLPGITSVIPDSTKWIKADSTLLLIIPRLMMILKPSKRGNSDARGLSLLSSILETTSCPSNVVQLSCLLLLTRLVTHNTRQPQLYAILTGAHQRHPGAFADGLQQLRDSSVDDGVTLVVRAHGAGNDPIPRAKLDQFILGLSLNAGSSEESLSSLDTILSTSNTDASVRASGVRAILESLTNPSTDTPATVRKSQILALLSRLSDSDPKVVEAVYSVPSVLCDASIVDRADLISRVRKVLHPSSTDVDGPEVEGPSKAVIAHHLAFFSLNAMSGGDAHAIDIFEGIYAPYLLVSKSRRKTALLAWNALAKDESAITKGCSGTLAAYEARQRADDGVESEAMADLNLALTAKIAANFIASNDYARHFNFLISSAKTQHKQDAHTRLWSLLVLRALLGQLSGANLVDAANDVLGVIDSACLNAVNVDEEELKTILSDVGAARPAVTKPGSANTTFKLQASIFALLSAIPPPTGLSLEWLDSHAHGDASVPENKSKDMRGGNYVRLMRAIYALANSGKSQSIGGLPTYVLRTLFTRIKDDALLFLAGVWSFESPSDSTPVVNVHIAALRHAEAFLGAQLHPAPAQPHRDFQVVFPALLVAIQSPDKRIREAAVSCSKALLVALSAITKKADIYAFDVVYGKTSDVIQYADVADLIKYLTTLCNRGEHFIMDEKYASVFHQEALQRVKGEGKKEYGHKQRILCYLLSHVAAWHHDTARLAILRALQGVQDPARIPIVFPLIKALLSGDANTSLPIAEQDEYRTLLLAAYDKAAVPLLQVDGSAYWFTLLDAIKAAAESAAPILKILSTQTLALFPHLALEQKVEASTLFLRLAGASSGGDTYTVLKDSLALFMDDVSVILPLVTASQPLVEDAAQRASKRAKLDSTSAPDNDSPLPTITCLVEILASKSLPGSLDLIRSLLEMLARLCQLHTPARSDFDYVEQLLLSALDSAITHVQTGPATSSAPLRVDVLIELIRVSENPQTFQQALLLVASLARLAPDSVLHTIMPIFTFMGSNVFHRDDSYSYRVVQKTISSIVPVMVSHLKSDTTTPLELYINSREFLRVFTEASTHVPRHRRNKFFVHLTETLGPDDFLAPVCMLLVDKATNRVVRQKQAEVTATLSLPLGILHHFPLPTQVNVLCDAVREAHRLVRKVTETQGDANGPSFLEMPSDVGREDHTSSPMVVHKKQAHALVLFVGEAWLPSSEQGSKPMSSEVQELISSLLALTTVQPQVSTIKLDDVNTAARQALSAGLKVISVQDFVEAILPMLSTNDQLVKIAALNLLAERVGQITLNTRTTLASTLSDIVAKIQTIIETPGDLPVLAAALGALRAMASSASPLEEAALTSSVPTILKSGTRAKAIPHVLSALGPITIKLGPRLIPSLRDIVMYCVGALGAQPKINEDALDVLHNLLTRIPSFWGAELASVITRCLELKSDASPAVSQHIETIMETISTRLPPGTLLPALVQLWDSATLQQKPKTLAGFFLLLERALNTAPRADIVEHYRTLFRVLLEGFDLRSPSHSHLSDIISDIEDQSTAAFTALVTKLSEVTFTPLFRRLQDWAWGVDSGAEVARKITFCRLMSSLLDNFKGLMAPYVISLLVPITELLESYAKGVAQQSHLWSGVIELLSKSFSLEDAVWKEDHLAALVPVCVRQIAIYPLLDGIGRSFGLPNCLGHLANILPKEEQIKKINFDILMQTRSEDHRVRLIALHCASRVWAIAGTQLMGSVPETITFIHECAEDENDDVSRESRKLKRVMESVAGPTDA